MDTPRGSFEQVHVLRHSFRPNQPFEADLTRLTRAGHTKPLSFSVYGSDEKVIESYEVNTREFKGEKYDADRYLKDLGNVTVHPTLGHEPNEKFARVLMNQGGPATLQLVMAPTNSREYNNLLGAFDKIRTGRSDVAPGFKNFKMSRLYLNIPFEQLRPMEEVKENLNVIREKLADSANRLYQLTANTQLSGEFTFRPIQPIKPDPYGGTYYRPDSRAS